MNREIVSLRANSVKGDPSFSYAADIGNDNLTRAYRLGQPPMNRLSCVNQHANMRLINYRSQFPCSFRYTFLLWLYFIRAILDDLKIFFCKVLDKRLYI
jgi:hypothetical protein